MKNLFGTLVTQILGERSGKEIAKKLGVSPPRVSQIKAGEVPSDETLARLGHAFAPDMLPELFCAAASARLEKAGFEGVGEEAVRLHVLASLNEFLDREKRRESKIKTKHRTFDDFPDSFMPLIVVTGDKRETRDRHITAADLCAYTATPADTRWLLNLGLASEVIHHVDKNFLLLDPKRLIERFAETNILVIGSPAANHLARIVNRSAVFRFNYSHAAEKTIESIIEQAKMQSKPQLQANQQKLDENDSLAKLMRSLFTGGIFYPTYPDEYIAAKYYQPAPDTYLDFGVLTFCSNPFYEMKCCAEGRANDHRFVSIMAAGIHHPATAHAVRFLGRDKRRENIFEDHPYGGVLRVTLDQNITFSERTEEAFAVWEEEAMNRGKDRNRHDQRAALLQQLQGIQKKLKTGELRHLELTSEQAEMCASLIEKL